MRIAFVSYEYPLDTNGGGIGTYLRQVAGQLVAAGHAVDVFCGTPGASRREADQGARIHLIRSAGSPAFKEEVTGPFVQAHGAQAYDVVEGCDFDASALRVHQALPALPYVVKLHTPRFFVDELHHVPTRPWDRVRIALGAIRRLRWPRRVPIRAGAAARDELAGIQSAHEVAAPSTAIARLAREWCGAALPPVSVFPYPFVPGPELLTADPQRSTRRVTYLGRLEARKGVLDLAAAVPLIARAAPDVHFRFVGRDQPSPLSGVGMQAYLRKRLAGAPAEVAGPVAPADIPRLLAESDIVVVPSHWENHAMVCCEAMAAGCAVVASDRGGLPEILDEGRCGRLVPPRRPDLLAAAVGALLAAPAERSALGAAARRRILEHFSAERVLALQLASYDRAIHRARSLAPA